MIHIKKRMDKPCVCVAKRRVSKPVALQVMPEKEGDMLSASKRVGTWLQPALSHSTALSPEIYM